MLAGLSGPSPPPSVRRTSCSWRLCVPPCSWPGEGAACWRLFGAFPVAVGAVVAAYNLHIFGRITGGYGNAFGAPFWPGLAGLLVSPARGLFVYTPVALFSLLGAAIWLTKPQALADPGLSGVGALFHRPGSAG